VGRWIGPPEKAEVKIGFIPLTDAPCRDCVEMGFDKKYGLKITPSKEASWASVRDKLVNGELDASHVCMSYLRRTSRYRWAEEGHGNVNEPEQHGQSITLSNQLKEKGQLTVRR